LLKIDIAEREYIEQKDIFYRVNEGINGDVCKHAFVLFEVFTNELNSYVSQNVGIHANSVGGKEVGVWGNNQILELLFENEAALEVRFLDVRKVMIFIEQDLIPKKDMGAFNHV
jgi:hypothetical protein